MNLHNIAFAITNAAIWLTVYGANGRSIGDHLWVIEEGTPPEFNLLGRSTYNTNYWSPPRFAWRPFQYSGLMREGFVAPLCGRRSQARRPRIGTAWGNGGCDRCIELARGRGIIPLTYAQASAQSAIFNAVAAESVAWVAAGRPTEWPLPSPTN